MTAALTNTKAFVSYAWSTRGGFVQRSMMFTNSTIS